MRTKKEIAKEMYEIILNDKRSAMSFLSDLKDIDIFLDLAEAGTFSKKLISPIEKRGKGYVHPVWAQSIYLEFVANSIREGKYSIKDEIVKKYIDVLKGVTKSTENSTVVTSIFKCFSLLPANLISCKDVIHFFDYIYCDGYRDILLESAVHEGLNNIIKTVTDVKYEREVFACYLKEMFGAFSKDRTFGIDKNLLYFDELALEEFHEKVFNLESIFLEQAYLIEDSVNVFYELLIGILENTDIKDEESQYWRPSVEHHAQNQYHDSAQSMYVGLLYEYTSFLLQKGRKPNLIWNFKRSKYVTLIRIYISLTTYNHWVLSPDECAEVLIEHGLTSAVRHEAFHFLKNHFDLLHENVQTKILDTIEKLTTNFAKSEDQKIFFSALEKLRWLQAIKDSSNPIAKKMFSDCLKITGNEVEHPDFSTYSSGGWVGPRSPWTKEEFAKANPDEIISKLRTFKNTDFFKGPTKEGLSRTLEDFIAEDPAKASLIIKSLAGYENVYISAIYDGYAKAWKDKKYTPVQRLLEEFDNLLKSEEFCTSFNAEESKSLWAVKSFLRFLKAGLRSDENAFDPKFNRQCYEILKKMIRNVRPSGKTVSPSDAYTRAINEPRGLIFETAILWALREGRLASKDQSKLSETWNLLYELIKEPLITKDIEEVSLHALIGAYYRQFLFLNESWLYDNIGIVAPLDDDHEPLWVAFMEGFGYVTAFVKSFYTKLYSVGLLIKFLRYEGHSSDKGTRTDRLQGRVIELALVAYILEVEELDRGLVKEIINSKDSHEWRKLISSIVPILGRKPCDKQVERIKRLVSKLFEIYKSSNNKGYFKEHFTHSSKLLDLMNDPADENVRSIIEVSFLFSESSWELSGVVKYLAKHSKTNPKLSAELFSEAVLMGVNLPTFPEKEIRSIFEAIKELGEPVLFAQLCRRYDDTFPNFKALDGLR